MSTYIEVDEMISGALYAARKLPDDPGKDQLIEALGQAEHILGVMQGFVDAAD